MTIGEGYGSVTMSDGKGEEGEPLVVSLEAGRLWFVAGGERTDITDLVDEDTPYVHTYTDGEGVLHYFLVGGTPEDYGWFEGLKAPDGQRRRRRCAEQRGAGAGNRGDGGGARMVHGGNGAGPGPLAGPAGKIKWEKRAAVRPPAAFVRGEMPAHGPCAVASGPVWCAPLPAPVQGRGPDPPGLLGRLPSSSGTAYAALHRG